MASSASSTNFNVSSDCGAASTIIMQYPFIMHIGNHLYRLSKDGTIVHAKRASKAAEGCTLSVYCYPPGTPNLKLAVKDINSVKLGGYDVKPLPDSDVLSFTRV